MEEFEQRSGAGRELEDLASLELGVLMLVNLEAIHKRSVCFYAHNFISLAKASTQPSAKKKYLTT